MPGFLHDAADAVGLLNDYQSNVMGPDRGLYALPNQGRNRDMLLQNLAQSQAQQAPTTQAAQIDGSGDAQFRGQQQQLASQLANTIAGRGASPADLQLQQGLAQSIEAQRAAATSAGGALNPFLVQRQLAQQAAGSQQAMNAQLGVQRAQETQAAQQALGGLLGQGRSADQQLATNQAQLGQQASLANLSALQNQRQLAAQQQQYGMNSLLGLDQAQQASNIALARDRLQNAQYNNSINAGVAGSNQQTTNALAGGLISAGGAVTASALG